jgi:hypothetical protein
VVADCLRAPRRVRRAHPSADGGDSFRLDPEALEAAADYLDEYEAWEEPQQE